MRQAKVLVRYESDQRTTTPQDLEQMTIQTRKAGNVLLSSLGSWARRATPSLVEHDNMRRVITVNAYYRIGGDLSMKVMMTALSKINWPPGYGLEIRGDMTQMADSFGRLL